MSKSKKGTKLREWQVKAKSGDAFCAKCGNSESDLLSVDHIIPVTFLNPLYFDSKTDEYNLVYNDEENFQFLCKYCNGLKGNKLDIRNPKTIPLLKKLILRLEERQNEISSQAKPLL